MRYVDRGYSLHTHDMGITSLGPKEKKTIRKPRGHQERQTASGSVRSAELGNSSSWTPGANLNYRKEKTITCCTDNFVPPLTVPQPSANHPLIQFSSQHSPARGNPLPEKEVEETMLKLFEPISEEFILDDAALVRTSP